ncbi:hypothetical protein Leryth_021001 [Lithospermum erythrorhizon]|nr:hypothetical protein Leryth_021001 [Lithospermum erythrorhizon]
MILNCINNFVEMKATPRSLKHSPTTLMPSMNQFLVQLHEITRIKSTIAHLDTINLPNSIQIPKPHNKLPYHSIHPGTQPAASDNGSSHLRRFEEYLLPRPCPMVGQVTTIIRRWRFYRNIVEDVVEDDVGGGDVEA